MLSIFAAWPQLSFRSGFPLWAAGALLVVLLGLVVWVYLLEGNRAGIVRRCIMATCRFLLLALIVFLLCRPMLIAQLEKQRKRDVVFLLDDSKSMKQQDRRMTNDDKLRVAIAEGLVPFTTKVKQPVQASAVPAKTTKDPSRAELVRSVLTHSKLELLKKIQKTGPVRMYLFGSGQLRGPGVGEQKKDNKEPKKEPDGEVKKQEVNKQKAKQPSAKKAKSQKADDPVKLLLRSFKADQTETKLADAVHDVLHRQGSERPAAIVVVTDGLDNASRYELDEVAKQCRDAKVPLHIYGVGTAKGGSLQLKEVVVPRTLFYDDTVFVPIRWQARGFDEGTVVLTLTANGKKVDQKEFKVRNGDDLREILQFTPKKSEFDKDKVELAAKIELKDSKVFKDELAYPVNLVDSKIRILYIENAPRFEYKFLQPALLRDRRVKVDFLLLKADPKVLNSGPPFIPKFPTTREDFFKAKYNLIILGDVPAKSFSNQQMEWIRDFVKGRGGLIVIAGRQHMPADYIGTPLQNMLPIEFTAERFRIDSKKRTKEYQPTLTLAGQRTGMLSLADEPKENLEKWNTVQGFHWFYPAKKLRPGATSWIVHPTEKLAKTDEKPMPIMASQYFGKGQVVYMGTDETWRWRFNTQDKLFSRFWGQVIYKMGLPHLLGNNAARMQAALERSRAVLDKSSAVFVRLLDKNFEPRKDETVEAKLEFLDAKAGDKRKTESVKLFAIPDRPGDYRGELPTDRAGRFKLTIENPEPDYFQYRVELPPGHELDEAALPESTLRKIAEKDGVYFYREEDLQYMADNMSPKIITERRPKELWLDPWLLLAFIGLITTEWVTRKFSNMS